MTEALADNSHAGGAFSRVRTQDVSSVIFATGTINGMKETQFPDTAHFDHIVTLAPALDASNAVLSRAENDARYFNVSSGDTLGGSLDMDDSSLYNVAFIDWHGNGIDIEAHASSSNDVWNNWNADLLDGYHADSFATTQQLAEKLSVTGGLADTMFKMTVYGGLGPENQRAQLAVGGNGTIALIGGEETVADDNMHIKMLWDVAADEPSDPCIDLKPYGGASLKGLGGSDRWWTDGRFTATNAGKTSEFFAVNSGHFHVQGNTDDAAGAAVAGGTGNLAETNSFVGGGQGNRAQANSSAIIGGMDNVISNQAYGATVGGGWGNCIRAGRYSFIGEGYYNCINVTHPSASAVLAGGYMNFVSGAFSVIPGGYSNMATGSCGFAAGSYATAGHVGTFVWSDYSSSSRFQSTSSNQFLIRAKGGVGINTNLTDGKALSVAGDVDVAGTGRFSDGLFVPQQGDISMGSYTNGTF